MQIKVKKMSNGRMMGTFIFAIIIVVAFSLWAGALFQPPTPVVTISDAAFSTDLTHVNTPVDLTVALSSHDKDNNHNIEVQFESHSLVTFQVGNQPLSTSGGAYAWDTTIGPNAGITQPFKVTANLESGIAELSYQITIKLYADGAQVDSKVLTLKVQA